MTNIDYNAIIAYATAVIAFFAIIGLVITLKLSLSESKRTRFSLGIDLILRLDTHFNSGEFRRKRNDAATGLLSGRLSTEAQRVAIDDVLNFFETVGFLTRRDVLDAEVAWNHFFYYMHRYMLSAKKYIETCRKEDPTLWEEFIEVYERLKEVEKRERRLSDKDLLLSDEDRRKFLNSEAIR